MMDPMTENDRSLPITGDLPGQPLKKEVGLTKMAAQRQKAAALLKP
jgi:hypothetical protein